MKSYFLGLWEKAHAAGMEAGKNALPTPMVVTQHTNMLDGSSPVEKAWYVADGACGFAWVVVRPGNSAFARWAKKFKSAHKHYYGGMMVKWVGEFNQSVARKEAYANAFARVLQEAGLNATAGSRLD